MNYRHAYHAGNFADAFKHIVLTALTKSFLNKDSAFCYLDTHAGTGRYDLTSQAAQTTQEFQLGIQKLFTAPNPPKLVQDYLACVKSLNLPPNLKTYPGSPYFVNYFLRPQDRMVLSELHPEDFQLLRKNFSKATNISIHKQDGYQTLKASLPPKERRGLVLIDPPYENPDEFRQLTKTLPELIKRWETGVFAIWYPIKLRSSADLFLKKLQSNITRPTLISELSIYPEDTPRNLNGSGMFIINPPWKLQEEIEAILPWLKSTLQIR
jgi:23S rRNA (adenine2030-N6)-methyltransferase